MYRKLILIFFLGILTTNASVSVPSNLIVAAEEEDTLEMEAEEIVKEAEKIFKETENDIEERRSRISQFTSKVTKVLSTPFTKALTKVTLIQMEVICSAIDDFESAGFACFPQLFILSEVLGKKNVDSGQLIQALSNKKNDWKFRWLIAEGIGHFHLNEATNPMMEIILDESENVWVREECLFMVPAKGKTYKGKPIVEYFMQIFKEEKEVGLRDMAATRLGGIKYKLAIDLLLQAIGEDTSKVSRVVMVRALGNIGDKRALPGMFALLKDKELKGYVAEQLGKIGGGEEVVDTLISLFENDKDSFVRYCAGCGLARSRSDKAYKVFIKHKAVMTLGEVAGHGSLKALDALKEIGTPKALEKLRWLSTRQGSRSKKIREKAKELLKEIEGEE